MGIPKLSVNSRIVVPHSQVTSVHRWDMECQGKLTSYINIHYGLMRETFNQFECTDRRTLQQTVLHNMQTSDNHFFQVLQYLFMYMYIII